MVSHSKLSQCFRFFFFLGYGFPYFKIVTNVEETSVRVYQEYKVPTNTWVRFTIVRRYERYSTEEYFPPTINIFLVDHTGRQHTLFKEHLVESKLFRGVPLYSGTQTGKIRNFHINGKQSYQFEITSSLRT